MEIEWSEVNGDLPGLVEMADDPIEGGTTAIHVDGETIDSIQQIQLLVSFKRSLQKKGQTVSVDGFDIERLRWLEELELREAVM